MPKYNPPTSTLKMAEWRRIAETVVRKLRDHPAGLSKREIMQALAFLGPPLTSHVAETIDVMREDGRLRLVGEKAKTRYVLVEDPTR